MSDLISRQAAIDALGERPMVWTDDDQYALGERNQYDRDRFTIGTLPPAEVTLCHLDSPCEYQNADIAMPSALPTAERVGHWVYKKIDEKTGIEYHEFCSECGFPRAQIYGEYCAVCGARMEG